MNQLFNRPLTHSFSHASLPDLDGSLYPLTWGQHCFYCPQDILLAMMGGTDYPNQQIFCDWLQANDIYQQWINFTVFGRYVQRSFSAFYRQSEDCFNTDMPELLRHELMRHAQYLPVNQILFFAGALPRQVRQEKLLMTTLNPITAINDAKILLNNPTLDTQKSSSLSSLFKPKTKSAQPPQSQSQPIINYLQVCHSKVLGFAVRHNKRTSERLRNEVMILDFTELRLVNEQSFMVQTDDNLSSQSYLLREYHLR